MITNDGNRSRAREGDRPIVTGLAMVLKFAKLSECVVFAVKKRQSPARERLPNDESVL